MKKPILALGCALAAVWGFALPAPRWVPAKADLVAVGETSGSGNAALDEAWRKAYKAEGIDFEANAPLAMAQLKEISPHLPGIVKAFGVSDDLKHIPAYSVVYAFALPERADDLAGAGFPKGLGFYFVLENAKLDIPAFDKAVAALCEEKGKEGALHATFKRSGDWRTFVFADKASGGDAPLFLGYRPTKGGLALALCATQAEAEAWFSGKTPAIAADSPLMAAFTPVAGAKGDWGRLRLADLAGVFARLSTPEARKEMSLKVPLLQKVRTLDFGVAHKGVNVLALLSATTDDEASATQLRDFLLGWKGMATQMFLPMLTQKPDSALAAAVNALTCEAKGKQVLLRWEITPAMGAKAVKECQAIAARQAAQQTPADLPGAAPAADEDDEPMSEEEARKILEALETK